MLQLLVPKPARKQLFLSYHASLFGGHLGRNRTLARLAHRFYWSGMSDDVKEWLGQCTVCIKRKSPAVSHHPLGNIPTGHRWDRMAMDILDMCDPTPAGYRYILVIAGYFSKWTEAFPIKNKCADTVADVLVEKIIFLFLPAHPQPFYVRDFNYQDSRFHSVAHLMCYRHAVVAGQKTFATGIRKWSKHLVDFPTPKFKTLDYQQQWRSLLMDIYGHLYLTDMASKTALIETGPR